MKDDKTIKMNNVLTADALFGAEGASLEMLEIPELGGAVYLRQLSAREVMSFAKATDMEEGDPDRIKVQNDLIGKALVDADGERIVPVGEEHRLGDMPMKAYLRIVNTITSEMSMKITGADVAEATAATGDRDEEGNAPS